MATDKREGWLKNLKVGDEVAVDVWMGDVYVTRVVHITPTGKIDIPSGGPQPVRFSAQGRTGDAFRRRSLMPVTDEIRRKTHRRALLHRLGDAFAPHRLSLLPDDVLEALWVVVKNAKADK